METPKETVDGSLSFVVLLFFDSVKTRQRGSDNVIRIPLYNVVSAIIVTF